MSDPTDAPQVVAENGPEAAADVTETAAVATEVPAADTEENATTAAAGDDAAAPPAPPNPMLDKYNEYWNVVKENPADFQTWTMLIQTAEKLDDNEKSRAVFDAFLSEYPLCYGYWKKYADAEVRHGNSEMAGHVYERGVSSIPYSVDLWGHYVAFKQSVGAAAEDVRGIFERGLAYVATDYSAHTLWDKYIQFETAQGTLAAVGALYTRILQSPLKELERYQNSLKDWVASNAAAEIMTEEELSAYKADQETQKQQARDSAKEAAAAAAKAKAEASTAPEEVKADAEGDVKMEDAAAGENGDAATTAAEKAGDAVEEPEGADAVKLEGPEGGAAAEATGEAAAAGGEGGEAKMEVEEGAATDAAAPVAAVEAEVDDGPIVVTEDEIKQAWLQARQELCSRTKEELAKRKPYEDQIKRPYFHVKALDAAQLNNWNRYLTFIEQHGDEAAIITLYERCLVACACYPEFWQRYIRLMEGVNMDHATGALQRAVVIYCKRKPEMHLFAAHFEERHGNADNARRNHKYVLTELSPRLLTAVVAAANFEARQGNRDAACAYYEDLIQEEKAKDTSKIYTHLCIQYAQFLRQKYGDAEKGRAVLAEALEHSPASRALWEAAIFFEECAQAPDMVARALALYDRCSAAPEDPGKGLPLKDREELSLRSLELADQYGDPAALYAAEKAHAARFMLPTALTTVKKRAADYSVAPAAKVARTDAAGAALPPHPPVPPPAAPAPPAPAAAGYYGQAAAAPAAAAAAAAGYNYAAYYQQYPGYGYGYGY